MTNGHLRMIERGLEHFDRIVVAVARNPGKNALFSIEDRMGMVREVFAGEARLIVNSFEGLLVDYARAQGIHVILRGLRAVADFEYEYQMANMNRTLAPGVETVFLMADPSTFFVSSRLVKEVAQLGGNIDGVVPPSVRERLLAAYSAR